MNYVEGNVCNNDINEENWHKRGYHTHSDVIFGWVAWICLSISDFFAEYLDFVFTMGGKIEKSHGGPPPGPRGGAEAGAEPRGPVGIPTPDFQIWNQITKNIMLLSKEVRDTQPNPRYSAKNNDAIRMIASFRQIF